MTNKHNKKRNTAFIYEALVREVVKQSIESKGSKRDFTISLIKKHFNKKSLLYKDLILYKTISETKGVDESFASRLLQEITSRRDNIDKEQLFKEQSSIISQINKNISKTVFSNFVPSYKFLASIGQFFNDDLKPKAKVLLEGQIIDSMVSDEEINQKKNFKLNGSIMKSFTKRFNETYDDSLISEQKTLLSGFIKSFADNGLEFKIYLDREISRLAEKMETHDDDREIQNDPQMKKKFQEVFTFLKESNKHPIDKSFVLKIAQIQKLIKEIDSDD